VNFRLIIGDVTAAAVLGVLREVVRLAARQADWRFAPVLLPGHGKEFKGAFAVGCDPLKIEMTGSAPHAGQRVQRSRCRMSLWTEVSAPS
jgi:hypothetical protein